MQKSTNTRRSVLVTGSNKGIGYSIVKKLLEGAIPYDVILTSRSVKLGEEAFNTLKKEHTNSVSTLTYHQLDITDDKSIDNFIDWLKKTSGKLDVLVNNAAIAGVETTEEERRRIINTNFFSTIRVTEKLIPLLSDDAKVLIVSSLGGLLAIQGDKIKKPLEDENLTEQQLLDLGKNFVELTKDFTREGTVLLEPSYPGSKALINTYVRKFLPNKLKKNQQCYSIHPGMCDTEMAVDFIPLMPKEFVEKLGALVTADDGADTPVYLINLPFEKNPELNAKFFSNREVLAY